MLDDETVEAAAASLARLARALQPRAPAKARIGSHEVSAEEWALLTGHTPDPRVRILVAADDWRRVMETKHG